MQDNVNRQTLSSDDKLIGDAGETAASDTSQTARPFDSLEAFAAAHTDLLQEELTGDTPQQPDFLERVRDLVKRGAATGVLLKSVSDRRMAQSFLNYWLTVLYRAGDKKTNAIVASYVEPADEVLASDKFPYMGLRPFTEADKDKFYGRKQMTANIVKALSEKGLVVLVGPSGSGKTSLIDAGVVPALKEGSVRPGSENWRHFPTIVPGREPLASLAALLVSGNGDNSGQIQQEAEKLLQSSEYLLQRFNECELPVVLIIDQFDELFTLSKDDQKRDAFIVNLLSLIKSSKHKVILSMRSDRISYVVRRPDLNELFRDVELRMSLLQESDLHEVIEKPARAIGLEFQTGVVEQLIRETYGDPVGLPLLQFGLLKLWEEKEGNTITWPAMNRMRSCRNGLIQNAVEFFAALSPEEKKTTRRILLKMVRLSDNLEVASDTARREDLYQQDEAPETVDRLLEAMVKGHLVRLTPSVRASVGTHSDSGAPGVSVGSKISPDDQFELAHDSLARDWPELVGWLRKLREAMLTRQRLESLANNWAILGRKDIGLLDKYQLHEAEKWLQSPEAVELGYQNDVTALVEKSREAIDRERLVRKAVLVSFVSLIVVALILAVIVAVVFYGGWVRSTSRQLAHKANELKTGQLDAALLLSLAAFDTDSSNPDAIKRLVNSLAYSPKLNAFLHAKQPQAIQIVFSPDGRRLSALSLDGTTTLWDTTTNKQIGSTFALPRGNENYQENVRGSGRLRTDNPVLLSRSGKLLVSQGEKNTLVIWDVEAGKTVETIAAPENATPTGGAFAMAFSHDDLELAWLTRVRVDTTQAESFELSVWSFTEKKKVQTLVSQERLQVLAFSPDNQMLSGATADGDVLLWQARNLALPMKRLKQAFSPLPINRILFSQDGKNLAAVDPSGAIAVWRVRDLKRIGSFTPGPKGLPAAEIGNPVLSFAISRNGERVVAGYDDGSVIFWNLNGDSSAFPSLHGKQVTQVAFGAEDKKAVTVAGQEGSVFLWDLNSTLKEMALPTGRSGRISAVSFSPDNRTLAASSYDGTIVLWDLRRTLIGEQLVAASSLGSVTNQLFSDDARLISKDASDKVTVFDVARKQPIKSFSIGSDNSTAAVSTGDAVISKNGRVLAVRQLNNEITYWDIESGQMRGVLKASTNESSETPESKEQQSLIGEDDSVKAIAISPDGNRLASGKNSGTIILWDLENGKSIDSTPAGSSIRSLAFNRDASRLASGDDRGVITIWAVTNLQKLFPLEDKDKVSLVSNLSFSPDGTKLASVREDGTVHFWDLAGQGQLLSQLESGISNVVFDHQGTVLACIKYDGSIIFWDVETQQPIGTFVLSDDENPVVSLAYAPDRKTLAAGHRDGSIQLLNIGIDAWRTRACGIANRNLSLEEVARYTVLEDQELISWFFNWTYSPVCTNLPSGKDAGSQGYARPLERLGTGTDTRASSSTWASRTPPLAN